MTNTELAAMLAQIVCPSDKPPMWNDGDVFITNGHVAFCVNAVERATGWAIWSDGKWVMAEGKFTSVRSSPDDLKRFLAPIGQSVDFTLPEIEYFKSWDNPRELVQSSCEECDGTGKVECNYGHEHECEDCGGTGKVEQARIDLEYMCIPTKERAVKTDFGYFDARYLWMLRKLSEHSAITFIVETGKKPELNISFDGGTGNLMGIKFHD